MRERRANDYEHEQYRGITPARAGKTAEPKSIAEMSEDHPRPCGKDHVLIGFLLIVLGSPPPVRERPYLYI